MKSLLLTVLILLPICCAADPPKQSKVPTPWTCRTNLDGKRVCARTVPAGDDCNTCTIDDSGDGLMVCTSMYCIKPKHESPVDPKCQPKKGETIECPDKP
jgi:hypothetical protein